MLPRSHNLSMLKKLLVTDPLQRLGALATSFGRSKEVTRTDFMDTLRNPIGFAVENEKRILDWLVQETGLPHKGFDDLVEATASGHGPKSFKTDEDWRLFILAEQVNAELERRGNAIRVDVKVPQEAQPEMEEAPRFGM